MKKILFCGLNKTGTTSLHEAFTKVGLSSYHGKEWINWLNANIMPDYDVFSDGSCENINIDFLDDRFTVVLNTRSLYNWLLSRCKHARAGFLLGRRLDYNKKNISDWIDIRKEWHERLLKVNPFIFNIEDKKTHISLSNHLGLDLDIQHLNNRDGNFLDINIDIEEILKYKNIKDWHSLL